MITMIPSQEIQSILRTFNLKGYADEAAKYQSNGKNGQIIKFTEGDFTYEDEFYGGEPYSGNETIWYKSKDIFRCVYWGKVIEGINFSDIYQFLRAALRQGPTGNCVHRGPEKYTEGEVTYTNTCIGTIDEFVQIERIFIKDTEVYTAHFIGGRVSNKS